MSRLGFLTIGYGNLTLDKFIALLKKYNVNYVIDVRSNPYDKYKEEYDKEKLREKLFKAGIEYLWLGNRIGEKYENPEFCFEDGKVNYTKVEDTMYFKRGIDLVKATMKVFNLAIMGSNAEPLKCHRFFSISKVLRKYNIYHVLSNSKVISNETLEEEIHSKHIGDKYYEYGTEEDRILTAYENQARKEGYTCPKNITKGE